MLPVQTTLTPHKQLPFPLAYTNGTSNAKTNAPNAETATNFSFRRIASQAGGGGGGSNNAQTTQTVPSEPLAPQGR